MKTGRGIGRFDFAAEYQAGGDPGTAAEKANRYRWQQQNKTLNREYKWNGAGDGITVAGFDTANAGHSGVVLENSLRGNGDRLRVTVQLLQVKDQSHLWAQDFDYRPRDILSLEDDVAKAVAREIQIRLTPQQQADLTRLRPVNAEAFDAYMEGRFFLNRDNDGDLNRAASYYEQAINLDSSYAPAWVGLSRARFRQADRGFIPHEEGQRQAREAAEQALALDPSLPEAHARIGADEEACRLGLDGSECFLAARSRPRPRKSRSSI